MAIPTNATVTVEQPDGGTVDEYGNPVGAFTSVGSYSVWLERVGWNPADPSGDVGEAADWTVWFADTGAAFDAGDRVVDGDRTFELVAATEQLKRPGGTVHHVVGHLRPATPTLREMVTAGLSMSDRCTVERVASDDSFDTGTGVYTAASSSQVYVGPCRVLARAEDDRVVLVADERRSIRSIVVLFPYDVTDVEIDDLVTVTASEDARLQGRPLRVTGVEVETAPAVRTLYCEDEG